MKVQLVRSKTD